MLMCTLLHLWKKGRGVNLKPHMFSVPRWWSLVQISISCTFPVEWAAETKGIGRVWNWQYGNSGLVEVQIGTAVLVGVSVRVWNWQYGNSGLVGVQIGTAVLVGVSVRVWNWQYGNSGLVGVQIGTAVLVWDSVSVWNWHYGNSGLVEVQIGSALLMIVSLFRDVQGFAYS
jgi:hypothetical protein